MNYYVYIYLDPRKPGTYQYGDYSFDYEPFYVGKGSGNQYSSHLRHAQNLNSIMKTANRHKYNKIKNILKNNLKPIILKIKELLSEKQSLLFEKELISSIGRSDLKTGPLTNMTDGGDGAINRILNEETKIKISLSNKGKHNYSPDIIERIKKGSIGRIPSKESKLKMSKSRMGEKNHFYGKTHSKETIQKISLKNTGFKHTEETKIKMSNSKKGKTFTEDHKRKIGERTKGNKSFLGRHHSDETKIKISSKTKGKFVSSETRLKLSKARKLFLQKRRENTNEESI